MKQTLKHSLVVIATTAITATSSALAGDYYQAGSQWDKTPLDLSKLDAYSPGTRKLALAVGKHLAGGENAGGTVFYLGKFAGRHLMATNHHVFPYGCRDERVRLASKSVPYYCTHLMGTWQAVDTTIFEISVPPADEEELARVALRFAPRADLKSGMRLANIGYGDNLNPRWQAMVDEGNDCFVISPSNEIRLVGDPEEGWDSGFKVWSFAHGCESSHGDSGSPIVDRETGEVVGLIWATSAPKKPRIQDTNYLLKLAAGAPGVDPNDVWRELNYAVAVPKLFELMQGFAKGERSTAPEEVLHPEARVVIRELLKSYGF